MSKRIIFFDGDGTLWYPKKTKHKTGAWWVYKLPGGADEHIKHLILTPTTLTTLTKLKKKGIITILLSTHPYPPKEAMEVLNKKVETFEIKSFFDEVHATREYYDSKGEFMVKILKDRDIPKSDALMVGDSYNWDYKPAKDNGIDAVIIEKEYHNNPVVKRIKRKITNLEDVLKFI